MRQSCCQRLTRLTKVTCFTHAPSAVTNRWRWHAMKTTATNKQHVDFQAHRATDKHAVNITERTTYEE